MSMADHPRDLDEIPHFLHNQDQRSSRSHLGPTVVKPILAAVETAAHYAPKSRQRTPIENIAAWGKLLTYDQFMDLTDVVCEQIAGKLSKNIPDGERPDRGKVAEVLNDTFNAILARDVQGPSSE